VIVPSSIGCARLERYGFPGPRPKLPTTPDCSPAACCPHHFATCSPAPCQPSNLPPCILQPCSLHHCGLQFASYGLQLAACSPATCTTPCGITQLASQTRHRVDHRSIGLTLGSAYAGLKGTSSGLQVMARTDKLTEATRLQATTLWQQPTKILGALTG
jgi:hypothetical protein